jgi:uncharacterized protein
MLNFSLFYQNSDIADALKPYLQQAGMSSSIAEAHGLFTGLICTNQGKDPQQVFPWVEKLDLDIDQDNLLVKEALEILDAFYQMIKSSLASTEIEFQLAIIDNDPIEQRLADFSIWVQSFLYGLSLNKNFKLQQCSKQIQEIVNDFVKLSHAEDYELTTEEENAEKENEQSLFELIEYVRIGVITINDELNLITNPQKIVIPVDDSEQSEQSERQLH